MKQLTVKQLLNKAYSLIKPDRADIEKFTANFKLLLGHINPQESEENLKGHVMDFLKNTYYSPSFHTATKGELILLFIQAKMLRIQPEYCLKRRSLLIMKW